MQFSLFRGATLTLILSAFATPALAAKQPVRVSAPREYANPYQPALACLATQLTPEQRAMTIGIAYFAERTSKEAYAPENASGKFLSQGAEDMLINDLLETGMTAVEVGPVFRNLLDWTLPKLQMGKAPVTVALPDIIISGSFTTLDFGSSSVGELSVLGIGGGHRTYNLRYTLDARATSMPGGKLPGGIVLAKLALVKDVVGRETKAGVAGFFGPSSSPAFVELNFNTQKRELLQYSQRYMVSRTAYGIVADLWKITACQPQLEYGDRLISSEMDPPLDKK